jgi:hypothetical protein
MIIASTKIGVTKPQSQPNVLSMGITDFVFDRGLINTTIEEQKRPVKPICLCWLLGITKVNQWRAKAE